jgi:hypothetical protein
VNRATKEINDRVVGILTKYKFPQLHIKSVVGPGDCIRRNEACEVKKLAHDSLDSFSTTISGGGLLEERLGRGLIGREGTKEVIISEDSSESASESSSSSAAISFVSESDESDEVDISESSSSSSSSPSFPASFF